MKTKLAILVLNLAVLLGQAQSEEEWSRPHDPSTIDFSKKAEILNQWSLKELEKELERAKGYPHMIWYYVGSKGSDHVFLGIDYASPTSMVDDESGALLCDLGPFQILTAVSDLELHPEKKMNLKKNFKKWIEVDSIEDLNQNKS